MLGSVESSYEVRAFSGWILIKETIVENAAIYQIVFIYSIYDVFSIFLSRFRQERVNLEYYAVMFDQNLNYRPSATPCAPSRSVCSYLTNWKTNLIIKNSWPIIVSGDWKWYAAVVNANTQRVKILLAHAHLYEEF